MNGEIIKMHINPKSEFSTVAVKLENGESAEFNVLSQGRFWWDIENHLKETAYEFIDSKNFFSGSFYSEKYKREAQERKYWLKQHRNGFKDIKVRDATEDMRIIEVDAIVKVPFPHADAFKRDKAWDEIIKKCYASI